VVGLGGRVSNAVLGLGRASSWRRGRVARCGHLGGVRVGREQRGGREERAEEGTESGGGAAASRGGARGGGLGMLGLMGLGLGLGFRLHFFFSYFLFLNSKYILK
jgi:hypothetical protein